MSSLTSMASPVLHPCSATKRALTRAFPGHPGGHGAFSVNSAAVWDTVSFGHIDSLPWGCQLWGEVGRQEGGEEP